MSETNPITTAINIANAWQSESGNQPLAPHSTSSHRSVGSVQRRLAQEEGLLRLREKQRREEEEYLRTSEEKLLLEDEMSAMGEVLKEQSVRTGPALSAKDAELGVVRRALEELDLRKKSLQDILDAKGGSYSVKSQDFSTPKYAEVTYKLKVSPPDKWEGDYDRVKLETWIKGAGGYLNGIGIGDHHILDYSRVKA
ncbi:hypothetical protein JCM5353_005514 [Sporobolomyces roseus]